MLTEQPDGELTKYERITKELMLQMHAKGLTLERLSGVHYMDVSIRTLQKRARQFELTFPDYKPYAMRDAEERKRGPRKAT